MKIAYIGKIQLSDADLSYLNSAQKLSDITYIMEVTPRFMKGPAYNIGKIYPHSGVFKATEAYPEFEKYSRIIDVDKFYVVNTCGKFWQLKAFWTNFLLLLFLIRNKFDVIHLTWPANVYEFIIYMLKRKIILTVHDPFPHTGLDTRIVRLRRKVAFRCVPHFIILNKAQREKFLSFYHLPSSAVIDSRLSCYTYLNMVEQDMTTVPEQKYILFAGKISKYKGVEYLLEAMKKVHDTFPDIKLVVAGGGKYHFDISEYAALPYIDIRNRFIPDEELVALMNKTQFMVCPYTDATQSGVIMSSFTFGTPVIATRVGGLPEMLGNGKYGMLVKEKDTDALYQGICSLLSDEEQLADYRKEIAKDYTSDGYLSWKTIAEELRESYLQMASRKQTLCFTLNYCV
ncbi:glycosyltransferase family 4 protein [Segatella copri]|jgi:glycosyltransferase involved in cell wall biosynthesis|uniref:Glycosyltransferase family 1 protein n=1 Tax=Segatella copri TaxID=165179 RepID=A0AA92W123_9BACT|nr:glycosyltransferase family 4 protein [Segatella copri]RGN13147.1 glycosyltransferase family 1 protein [Segatella copri]RGQ13083.1 glycosyltransferase family 1 protein [Segatella copri]